MLKNLTHLSGAALISQLIAILAAPLLLRLYSPAAFGAYLAMTVITGFIAPLVTLRYELAIQATRSRRRVVALASVALVSTLIATVVLTVLVMLAQDSISRGLNVNVGQFLYFVPLIIATTGIATTLRFFHWREGSYRLTASSTIGAALATATFQAAFAYGGFDVHGVLLGAAVGQCLGAGILIYPTLRHRHLFTSKANLSLVTRTAISYRAYATVTAPAGILHMLALFAPAAIVSAAYGPTVAGYYYLGSRLISAPVNVLSSAVYPVFIGEAAKLHDTDRRQMLRVFSRFVVALLLLMSPTLLLFAIGRTVFAVFFGEGWEIAGTFAAWISIGAAVHLAATSTSVLTILRHNRMHALWVAANLVLIGLAAFAIFKLNLSPTAGVAVLSVAAALSYAALIALNVLVIALPIRNRIAVHGMTDDRQMVQRG